MATGKYIFPFLRKEQVAKNTFSFFFDKTKHEFEHTAGQYIRMILPNDTPDDRGTSRFFTVASPPDIKEHLMITTKVIQSTFKYTLYNLRPGDEVQFFGPLGSFILDENETNPHVYLAGGIGLTPFHSMLAHSASKNVQIPQTLLVSFSTREEMVFYDELSRVHGRNSNLQAIYTLTHPESTEKGHGDNEPTASWNGEIGRITEEMIRKYVSLTGEEIYYVCGPTKMVDAMREMVVKMGIDEERIRVEDFNGY